ncbi:hypothetical protein JCM8202_005484 [Rhodotorula sphaerocarpa]
MATPSFAEYGPRIEESVRTLAATLAARRQAGATASNEDLAALADEALTAAGAPKQAKILSGDADESGLERWRVEAMQAALTRALEVVVEEQAQKQEASADMEPLADVLDIVLSSAELGFVDDMVPLTLLSGVLELRPVSACEAILGYIETRIGRLTKGMEYQRGRGPILLRLLNDLLRRLPRSQSDSVILSGRILMLLSWVYPLNEKSGVNLRGLFNVDKGFSFEEPEPAKAEGQEAAEGEAAGGQAKMEVEEGEEAEEGKESAEDPAAFYSTFWSLQRYFINPPLLFAAPKVAPAGPSTSAGPESFPALRDNVRKTLSAFNAATKKAKDLAGSSKESSESRDAGKARQADADMADSEPALEEYFFPKFLTSPDLLDLELADPSFRRQILVQVLILFQYLLGFTTAERARAEKLPATNVSVFPNYVLPAEHESWIRELRSRTLDELDTMEGGRKFRKTVQLVLQRDQNWIDWKLRSCASFLKDPIDVAQYSEKARAKLRAALRKPKRYPYRLGNANLSRAWEKNLTSLDGFKPDVDDDELAFILREYRLQKNGIKQVEAQLARSAPGSAQRSELDFTLEQKRTRLQALHWRAIRSASTQHLRFFSEIGAGDLEKLEQLVDEERRKRDDAEEAPAAQDEGYDSDSSVLGMTERPEPAAESAQAEEEETKEGETGTVVEGGMGEEAGTPPPPPATPSAALQDQPEETDQVIDDEPGTPPPKAVVASPGTPKRPREEGPEDVAMQEGESAKRAKVE